MQDKNTPVLLARITAPHGVRGEVRVMSHTGDPLALGNYGPLSDGKGRTFHVKSVRPAKNLVVVRFAGIDTREAAEETRGTALYVPRSSLPDDLEEDEFYVDDLVGMRVEDMTGNRIGVVVAVPDFGAGHLLEIAPPLPDGGIGEKTWFLEFTRNNVPIIDFDRSVLRVDPPDEVSERDPEPDEPASTQ